MHRALHPPVLCLVSDRRRLPGASLDTLVSLCRAAALAGILLIQIREPDLDSRTLLDLTGRVLEATSGTDAAVVVNDRPDVALAAGAHGVHLRGDSVAAERVRAIAPSGFLIGRSVHERAEAVRAGAGVDYLVMGTVFATPGKRDRSRLAGLQGLEAACRDAEVPVLAIGGMSADVLPRVAAAGAAGIAAVRLFSDAAGDADWETAGLRLAGLVDAARDAFKGQQS